MTKIREYETEFLDAQTCHECDWVETPSRWNTTRRCCPKCGGLIEYKIGRFKIKETTSFLGTYEFEYLSFTARDPQP